MSEHWERLVAEWSAAGVIDEDAARRISEFEGARAGVTRWRWPMWLAMAFGGVMLGAGVLLFVAAHWDDLSPAQRFATVLASVGAFHVAGAIVSARQPAVATTLHAVGTVALGAGVFLAGQIFNLDEHWPGGVMLWAIGAALALLLVPGWPQAALVAVLTPLWLGSEWIVAADRDYATLARVLSAGTFLVSVAYFTSTGRERASAWRRTLVWIGGLSLPLDALSLALSRATFETTNPVSGDLRMIGWTIALGLPLGFAVAIRRFDAWPHALAVGWTLGLLGLQSADAGVAEYAWWAVGAAGLVAWGLRDLRTERINMGAAIFAATVVAYYFSELMSKLGRSASLIGLGLVFLAGGWAIERARRHFVRQAKEELS